MQKSFSIRVVISIVWADIVEIVVDKTQQGKLSLLVYLLIRINLWVVLAFFCGDLFYGEIFSYASLFEVFIHFIKFFMLELLKNDLRRGNFHLEHSGSCYRSQPHFFHKKAKFLFSLNKRLITFVAYFLYIVGEREV